MRRLAILIPLLCGLGACASPTAGPTAAAGGSVVAPYTARGNEPFWRLDVSAEGARWATPDGEERSDGPATAAPTPIVPGWRGFSAHFDGVPMTAEIRSVVCQDSMSGQTYPDTVTVTRGDVSYSGCGGDPMDLLTGSWRLETLFGAPALTGAQAATVDIGADGQLSGTSGCNRVFGQLTLTGEGIAIGGLGTTRMACLDPAVSAQERDFVAGLSGATAFGIDGTGRLVLQSVQGALVFAKSAT